MSAADQLAVERPIPLVRSWPWYVRDRLDLVDASLGAKNLWQYLATRADRYGESWPVVDTIARAFKVEAATVRRWRRELVELGELEVDYRPGRPCSGQRPRGNVYRLIAHRTEPRPATTARGRRAAAERQRRAENRATSRGLRIRKTAPRAPGKPRHVHVRKPRHGARQREQLRMEVDKEVATECGSCGRPRELVEGTPWCGPCSVAVTLRIQRLGEREP